MQHTELYKKRKETIESIKYKMLYYTEFDYNILHNIMYKKKSGRGDNHSYNDVIIMADTETSKKRNDIVYENHVCAWTISIRSFSKNIVTLYGTKPNELSETLMKIHMHMEGNYTYVYFHNLSYDWTFTRKFFFETFGEPKKQLNTKSHYPIYIEFTNGFILKDSLILAQRSLDKWAKDLKVEHQKAVGKWNYEKIRNQNEIFSEDEKEYIEHDTLAGVECIEATMKTLNKRIFSMPYTATGIPREECRNRGKEHNAHEKFISMRANYEQYNKLLKLFHGGYTHANRHYIDTLIKEEITCYDFASSYPFCMIAEKFPMEKFTPEEDCTIDYILENAENYAFMFCLILIKPRLKDDFIEMPSLQFSKCTKVINPVLDNGRILCAEYVEIYLNELDLEVINNQYDKDMHLCVEVESAYKDYLPRWFTDYTYELFYDKCTLKNGDPVNYMIQKGKLNSLYGMLVQNVLKDNLEENYITGEYESEEVNTEENYEKYCKKIGSIFPYQWGVWVTSYAFNHLFKLGECAGNWYYSDTDSCYASEWNLEKLSNYNEECKQKLLKNGYGAVNYNGKEYWLGVAEKDNVYSEYKVMGAKRYCGRNIEDNELHITVAGVPKAGYKCLKNDINNFTTGTIFDGNITGKKTHTYFYVDKIYTDEKGNITGDSIDLSECDYLLDSVNSVDWQTIFTEEIEMQVYDEI